MAAEKESPPLVKVLFHADRPTIPHYRPPPPFDCLPLILSCSLLIYPLRLSISFTSALSRFVFPRTLTHTYTPPPFLSLSLFIPSLPSQLSQLPLSRAHSFITGHHRRRGRLKKDNVSHLNTHTHTHTQPHTVHGFANAVHKLHGNLELICTKHFAYLQIRTAHTLSLTLSHTHTHIHTHTGKHTTKALLTGT